MLTSRERTIRIVTIDDDPLTHSLVAAILRSMDVEIHTALDGPSGLALARSTRPDLILLDYDMSGMDGLEVQARLQADPELCTIPVVFATGADGNVVLSRCFAAGVADYVRKPLCAPELRARITSVVERRWMTTRLEELVYRDPLTGLASRRALREAVRAALSEDSEAEHDAIVFLDVDRFKQVNDRLGHALGDLLLCEVARRTAAAIARFDATTGGSSMVARLGGDEFAVLIRGAPAEDGIEALALQVLDRLAHPYELGPRTVFASVSGGLLHLSPTMDPERAIRDADTAMFASKRGGVGNFTVFTGTMRDEVEQRLRLEEDIRDALEHDAFHVAYQPIVDLRSGAPLGVEALIRWVHPRRGLLGPMSFLPIAEEVGLILPIGTWVLDRAAAAFARWREEHGPLAPRSLHVNLSRHQLRLDDLVHVVRDILTLHGLPPGVLHLEVAEHALMQDPGGAEEIIAELRALGVRIDLDDFGTGHSSLSRLAELPLDAIKLDQPWLHHVERNGVVGPVVRAIANLAHDVGLEVMAEGIETTAQLELLRAMDVDCGQGWLFSRPLPESEVGAFFVSDAVTA